MKIRSTDVFWWVVMGVAFLVIVAGCLAMTRRYPITYDEPGHQRKITAIYPSVDWPRYRDAAREICQLDKPKFREVRSLAVEQGSEAVQAMIINTAYLCPDRTSELATVAR